MAHIRSWLLLTLIFLGLSIAAVVDHSLAYAYLPQALSAILEYFASPGEFLWWATLGGAFAGYPSGFTGYTVWVLGSTVFWVVAAVICVGIGRLVRSTLQHFRRFDRPG